MNSELVSEQFAMDALKVGGRRINFLSRLFIRVLKLRQFNAIYKAVKTQKNAAFIRAILEYQNVELRVLNRELLAKVPKNDAFIVVCNHPSGILDGVAVLDALLPLRADTKIVVNKELSAIRQLDDVFLAADRSKENKSQNSKFSEVKKILAQLSANKPVIFFPAARVSGFKWSCMCLRDRAWEPSCLKIIKKAQVTVFPIHIRTPWSLWYQILFLVHQKLGVLWLIPQFVKTRNSQITLTLKEPLLDSDLPIEMLEKSLKGSIYHN